LKQSGRRSCYDHEADGFGHCEKHFTGLIVITTSSCCIFDGLLLLLPQIPDILERKQKHLHLEFIYTVLFQKQDERNNP